MVRKPLEIDDLGPIAAAEQHQRHVLADFLGLDQGQEFEQLVQRAEAARHHHHRLGQIGKPELAHEEIVELEDQLAADVRVLRLLEGQRNVEADVDALGLGGPAVGRLHDPGATAATDHEAAVRALQPLRPLGQAASQFAGRLVVCRHAQIVFGAHQLRPRGIATLCHNLGQSFLGLVAGQGARRAEENNGIFDFVVFEAGVRLDVLGEDAQRPSVRAVQKVEVLVGPRRSVG